MLDGFKAVTRAGLLLQAGRRLDLPIALPIGNQTENVTVTGVTPFLQATSAEIGDVIGTGSQMQLGIKVVF